MKVFFNVGQVIEVKAEDRAVVQFLNYGYRVVFRWPQIDDVDEISYQFVFSSGLDLVPGKTGRTWKVEKLEELNKCCNEYKAEFFT